MLHPLEPEPVLSAFHVPPQWAQLLPRAMAVSVGRGAAPALTCGITGTFYNRSEMTTTTEMCLNCFPYKRRDTALDICSPLHLRNPLSEGTMHVYIKGERCNFFILFRYFKYWVFLKILIEKNDFFFLVSNREGADWQNEALLQNWTFPSLFYIFTFTLTKAISHG